MGESVPSLSPIRAGHRHPFEAASGSSRRMNFDACRSDDDISARERQEVLQEALYLSGIEVGLDEEFAAQVITEPWHLVTPFE